MADDPGDTVPDGDPSSRPRRNKSREFCDGTHGDDLFACPACIVGLHAYLSREQRRLGSGRWTVPADAVDEAWRIVLRRRLDTRKTLPLSWHGFSRGVLQKVILRGPDRSELNRQRMERLPEGDVLVDSPNISRTPDADPSMELFLSSLGPHELRVVTVVRNFRCIEPAARSLGMSPDAVRELIANAVARFIQTDT